MENSSSISQFSAKENITGDRIDISIKGIENDLRYHNDNHILNKIFQEIHSLEEQQKNEFKWIKSQEFVTKNDLRNTERKIMSKISEFADKQNVFNDRIDTAIADLQGDVKSLNDQIAALQASVGTVTPEDQALLDGITARASTIADKLDALDALTPPVVPPVV